MKKHLLAFLFFIGSWFYGSSQWVSIPDVTFVYVLQGKYPSCMNGNLMDTTCADIVNETILGCSGYSISPNIFIRDLTGIQYFDNLETLLCSENQISYIPALPKKLTYLKCWGNWLDSLPSLPKGLTFLDCGLNGIDSLPTLPDSLSFLECHANNLMRLPVLPNSLTALICYNNPLMNLPSLPSNLQRLSCTDNQLTNLPPLPNSLTQLLCQNNQLTSLPALPDSLKYCSIYNNPITCLPRLNKITQFTFYNTGITCLPNYPQSNTSSNPALSSIPICDSTNNPNGCEILNSIREIFIPSFTLFPNPAISSVTISIDETILGSTASVYDITGRKMAAVQLKTANTKLETSSFTSGIYFVTVENEKGRVTKKLVIQNP